MTAELTSDYKQAIELEPEITERIKIIAENIGAELVGLDERIKSLESYEKKRRHYDKKIRDIVRYTFIFSIEEYTQKVKQCLKIIAEDNQTVTTIKNYWIDDLIPYKGVNIFVLYDDAFTYEIQFHTENSYDIKSGPLHDLYKMQNRIKNIDYEKTHYHLITDQMFELTDTIVKPNNIEEIENYGS